MCATCWHAGGNFASLRTSEHLCNIAIHMEEQVFEGMRAVDEVMGRKMCEQPIQQLPEQAANKAHAWLFLTGCLISVRSLVQAQQMIEKQVKHAAECYLSIASFCCRKLVLLAWRLLASALLLFAFSAWKVPTLQCLYHYHLAIGHAAVASRWQHNNA